MMPSQLSTDSPTSFSHPPASPNDTSTSLASNPFAGPYTPTLIIHGGAGSISRSNLPPVLYNQYYSSLLTTLLNTKNLLTLGYSALDAACSAVCLMEDNPLFNCGRGSVFTSTGTIEMEASVAVTSISSKDEEKGFDGIVKKSAAVSMIRETRHPVLLAKEVLKVGDEEGGLGSLGSMHGHLSGRRVEEWGFGRGLEKKTWEWFWTKRRWEEHRRGLKKEGREERQCDERSSNDCESRRVLAEDESIKQLLEDELVGLEGILELPSQGTVGAVCMDSWGVIAVATSTGGLTNKLPGRIGDTPTVGAGFWAETWTENVGRDQGGSTSESASSTQGSFSERLAAAAKAEFESWLSSCLTAERQTAWNSHDESQRSVGTGRQDIVEKQPLIFESCRMPVLKPNRTRRRAVAMSGTGNGDSFLRTNACRTAAAMSRFSSCSDFVSLAEAVRAVAGPSGELQRSAGDRWGKTGEGQGGIIGIELISGEDDGKEEGKAVFAFNCGGLWRAYFEKDCEGKEQPRIMVFRDKY